MDRNETSDEVSQEEFTEAVLRGGKRRDVMRQLATASPAPGTRASDTRFLAEFVSEVLSILQSRATPFEGMLEAPSPIIRLYQTHKESMKGLRPHRDAALELLLRDALAALYNGVDPLAWTAVEAAGTSRTPPEQAQSDPTENP